MFYNLPVHVGIRVARLIRERGWKQAELARRVGVSRSMISVICRGQDPSLSLLRRIAVELGVTESELLEGTDAPARTLRSASGAGDSPPGKAVASG